jgi:hypothetical protein
MDVVLPSGATDATFFVTRHPIKSISNSIIDFDLRNVENVLPRQRKEESTKVAERINSHYMKSRQIETRSYGDKHEDDFQQYNWGLSLTLEMGLYSDQAELLMVLYAKNVEGRLTEKEFRVIIILHTTFRHLTKYKQKSTWKDLMTSWKINMKKSRLLPPTCSKKAFIKILDVNFIDFDIDIDQISKDFMKLDYEGDYLQSLLLDDPILRGEIPPPRKKISYLPHSKTKDQIVSSENDLSLSSFSEKSTSSQDRQRMLRLQKSFSQYDEVESNRVQESESARREAIDASNDELTARVKEIKRERQIKRQQEKEKAQMEATADLFEATKSIPALERSLTSLHIPVSLPNTARKIGFTPRSAMNTSRLPIERSASYSPTPTSPPRKQIIPKTLSLPFESTGSIALKSTQASLSFNNDSYREPADSNLEALTDKDVFGSRELEEYFASPRSNFESAENFHLSALECSLQEKENALKLIPATDFEHVVKAPEPESSLPPEASVSDTSHLTSLTKVASVIFREEPSLRSPTKAQDIAADTITPLLLPSEPTMLSPKTPRRDDLVNFSEVTQPSNFLEVTSPSPTPSLPSQEMSQNDLHDKVPDALQPTSLPTVPPISIRDFFPEPLLLSPKKAQSETEVIVSAYSITEEVSQPTNFPNLTDLFELPSADLLFNVPKTGDVLRVLIRHDDEGDASGLFVHGFIPYSRAEEQGFLRVGDEIISVNGVQVEGKQLDAVVTALQHHHDEFVPIVIRRRDLLLSPQSPWRSPRIPLSFDEHSPRPFTTEDGSQPDDFPDLSDLFALPSKTLLFDVPKTNGQLRVMIRHDDDSTYKGLFVHGFRPYSNAEAQGLLQVGDEILEVDGVNIAGCQIEELVDVLKANQRDSVSLVVCRRDVFSGPRKANSTSDYSPRVRSSKSTPTFLDERSSDVQPSNPHAVIDFKTGTQDRVLTVPRTDGLLRVIIKNTGSDFYVHGFKGKSRAEEVLKPGDIILAINDNPVFGLTLKEVAALITSCDLNDVPMLIRRNYSIRSS